jgi:hypothetical protein
LQEDRDRLRNPQRRLPPIRLDDGTTLAADGRYSLIILFVQQPLDGWAEYVGRVRAQQEEMTSWDARLIVMAAPETIHARDAVTDGRGEVAQFIARGGADRNAGVAAAVLVADQWGEIHHERCAGAVAALPAPAELVAWARYLGTRCAECEGEAL